MQYEISTAVYMGMIANKNKYENSCHLKIIIQNMKFLYLILCLGQVCTDANSDAKANDDNDDDNANNNTRRPKHDCIRLFG